MKAKNKIKTRILLFLTLGIIGSQTVCAAPLVLKKGGASTDTEYDSRIQEARDTISEMEVGKYGMVPVYGRDIKDGTYSIEGESNSRFFKVSDSELTVKEGELSVRFMIPSESYSYIYPGTGEEAVKAKEELIKGEVEEGCTYFTLPVDALDTEIDCAAFSNNKQRWYDRKLVFDASSLPKEALLINLPDYEAIEAAIKAYEPGENAVAQNGEASEEEVMSQSGETGGENTMHQSGEQGGEETLSQTDGQSLEEKAPVAVDVSQPDGEYSIEVNMTGGSGRASISSPTLLIVRDGKAYAKLIWSSAYYDYLVLGGETFYNLTTDGGNSTFEIPITAMDEGIPIIGDTTAMGDPLEIDYTLTFYSDTIGSKSLIPQEAAKKVLVIAAVIIVVGGILNHFVKKKRR